MRKYVNIVILLFLIFNFALLTFNLDSVHAQIPAVDIVYTFEIADQDAIDGDILIYSDNGIVRANEGYSSKLFGVLQEKPTIVYRSAEESKKPVARGGVAMVNVTNAAGAIKPGDYITSSTNPGKGQKATISGYAIGVALEELDQNEGKIRVALRVEYVELTNTRSVLRLLDYFNIAAFSNDPEKASQVVKYGSAGLLVLGSLFISLFIFGRSITKSIEAIGRNPLAKTSIQLSILMTAGIIVLVVLLSLGAAYIILKL